MTTQTHALADLALKMGLTPTNAIALPTVIEVAARKVGMTQPAMIEEAGRNAGLRAYLAGICRQVTTN